MDREAFRKRFKAYKEGKPVSEIYDAGLPKYATGTPDKFSAFVDKMGPYMYYKIKQSGVQDVDTAYENMMRQLALESNYGTSDLARTNNNFGGVGFNGKTYHKYKDHKQFIDAYVKLMTSRYIDAITAPDPATYAKRAHDKGYFTGSLADYQYNMSHMGSLNRAMKAHMQNNPDAYGDIAFEKTYEPVPYVVKPDNTRVVPIETIDPGRVPQFVQPQPKNFEDNPMSGEVFKQLAEVLSSNNKYKNGKTPKFAGGTAGGWTRANGNDIKFDEETGELVDQVTGEKGTMMLPEVIIKPRHYDAYNSTYDPWGALKGFNALTLGGLNNLSPSQWARRAYDLPKTMFGPMRFSTYMDRWINGNEGIVSSNFEQNHPYQSALYNGVFDILSAGGSIKGPKVAHNIKNRNQFFYRDLVPFGYENPFERGKKILKGILTEDKINLPDDYRPEWMDYINNNLLKNGSSYTGNVPQDLRAVAFLYGGENVPGYMNYVRKMSQLENRFRDAAYRKYLGLAEREPIYVPNKDGSFSYNLPYIEKVYSEYGLKPSTVHLNENVDWLTGNGGGVNSNILSFGRGISTDSGKTFKMQRMKDLWDI